MALLEISKQPCRICFDTADNTVSLSWSENGKTLAEMLCKCVILEFHENDGLPFQCCVRCKDDLIIAYKLLERCRQSDAKFRIQLLENKTAVRETVSPVGVEFINTKCEPAIDIDYPDTFKKENSDSSAEEEDDKDDANFMPYDEDSEESNGNEEGKTNTPKDNIPVDDKSLQAVMEINIDDSNAPERKRRKYVKRKFVSIPKRCCKCRIRFESLEEAKQHTNVHLDSRQTDPLKISARPYECSTCFKRYTKKRALLFHQREMYVDKPFECDECDQDFISEDQLTSHKELHSKEADERKKQLPKCCACYEQFESEDSLKTHCQEVHWPESQSIENPNTFDFPCPICHRRYKSRRSLLNHKLKPYRTKQYQCSQCGRIFRDKCSLSDHERSHQGERPFVCPVCSKSFTIKDSYRKHVKSHAVEDDHYKCETCGKGFKTKGNLKDHYITHVTDYRPLVCSLCSATFARKSCLKSHMRMHTGEKPFKCHLCDASYAYSSDLKRHIMAHTGIKPYICNICGRGYPRQDYLRKHMASHNYSSASNS